MTETEAEAHALVKRHLERSLPGSRRRRPEPQQQPEPARGDDARRRRRPRCAQRLVDSSPELVPRRPARPDPRAVDRATSRCSRASSAASSTALDLRALARRRRGDRLRARHPRRGRSTTPTATGSPSPSARRRRCSPTCATSPSPRCARRPTRSPACRTRAPSATTCSCGWSPRRPARSCRSPPSSATSTTSSRSTTSTGTTRATRRSPPRARRCARALRESDFAGRYGGEEFLILLPDTPLDGAVVAGREAPRRSSCSSRCPASTARSRASFGVAVVPDRRAGRRDARAHGRPRALRREGARPQLRRHLLRACSPRRAR